MLRQGMSRICGSPQIEKNRRIVNLQQGLGIFWLCPVYETAAGNIADACQLLFRAFEGILIMDGLRNARGQAARFEFGERSVKYAIGRADLAKQTSAQAACQPGSQRQREPGEGSV